MPEYVFLLGAAALTGSVVVGINDTRRGESLAGDIRHTDCAVVLTDSTKVSLLEDVDAGAPIRVTDGAEWTELAEGHRGAGLPAPLPGGDALFLLVFTSGSTGAPKAVRMTQGRALRMMAGAAAVYTERDVLYCSMPMFHTNALNGSLFPGLKAGASVVLKRRFSASAFLGDIRRHGCTSFNYVGRSLAYILAQPPTEVDFDNSLVFCIGAEASPRDRKEFRCRFGCYVVEGYTSSEGGVSINPFPGMPDDALGRPPEGIDVAIVDPTSGAERARAVFGEDHELLDPGKPSARSSVATTGHPSRAITRTRRPRGCGPVVAGSGAATSAIGTKREPSTSPDSGTDWLRVDGENFAAGPVELILGRHPDVAGSVVYAVPDPRTGDQVMAALELRSGATFNPGAFAAFLESSATSVPSGHRSTYGSSRTSRSLRRERSTGPLSAQSGGGPRTRSGGGLVVTSCTYR